MNALHHKNKILPTGIGSIGKARTLHPKGLGLSPAASSPLWWAICKSSLVVIFYYFLLKKKKKKKKEERIFKKIIKK